VPRHADFPLPDLSDERTAPFFEAAARGELAVPRCSACGRYAWYPPLACPACGAEGMPWVAVSGRGELFSWAVVRRAFLPAFAGMVPFVTGLVALDEDPAVRVVGYVVDCEPGDLAAGLPVVATFRPLAFPTVPGKSVTVPMFAPAPLR
jgi:uncharacterized OB-fold protein